MRAPYSCTATRFPAIGNVPSSAESRSRQVFGSGTASVGTRPTSLSAAIGLGPRQTSVSRPSAATTSSLGRRVARVVTSSRVPTPVRRIKMSTLPPTSASPNASASCWSASGISRMDGACTGVPPWFRINSATSADRRLSKLTTRRPVSPRCMI